MLRIGNATNFRRTLAGLALIAAPLVGFGAAIMYPRMTDDPNADLTIIASNPDRFLIANLLLLLMQVLLIPAFLGLIHLLRDRSAILGHIGGGLALLGTLGHTAFIGLGLTQLPLATYADRAVVLAVYEQVGRSPVFVILMLAFLIPFFLGILLLSIGLWRARVVPSLVPAFLVLAIVMDFLGPRAIGFLIASLLFLAGLGWIGVTVLRMPDAEWEHRRVPGGDFQLQPATT